MNRQKTSTAKKSKYSKTLYKSFTNFSTLGLRLSLTFISGRLKKKKTHILFHSIGKCRLRIFTFMSILIYISSGERKFFMKKVPRCPFAKSFFGSYIGALTATIYGGIWVILSRLFLSPLKNPLNRKQNVLWF